MIFVGEKQKTLGGKQCIIRGMICERIRNRQNIRKSRFMQNTRFQRKTVPSPGRSAATTCVEHFFDHLSAATSIVLLDDLQYTLADFYLMIVDCLDSSACLAIF